MKDLVLLAEATVAEILAELARRYEEMPPLPSWAAPVVITVAAHYQMPLEVLMAGRRNEVSVKVRHLCIALLAQLNPTRSRAEITAAVGLGHEMYAHALAKTEERVRVFADFRAEVASILASIRAHGHCRTSPQGTSSPVAKSA